MSERKTLTINTNTWYGRWYLMWKNRYGTIKNKEGYNENLCHFVRVLTIWAPIQFFFRGRLLANYPYNKIEGVKSYLTGMPVFFYLLIVGLIGALVASFVSSPLHTGLWILGLVAIAALFIAAIVGITILVDNYQERKIDRIWKQETDEFVEPVKDPTIFNVIWQFLRARKQKVCPLIEIEE